MKPLNYLQHFINDYIKPSRLVFAEKTQSGPTLADILDIGKKSKEKTKTNRLAGMVDKLKNSEELKVVEALKNKTEITSFFKDKGRMKYGKTHKYSTLGAAFVKDVIKDKNAGPMKQMAYIKSVQKKLKVECSQEFKAVFKADGLLGALTGNALLHHAGSTDRIFNTKETKKYKTAIALLDNKSTDNTGEDTEGKKADKKEKPNLQDSVSKISNHTKSIKTTIGNKFTETEKQKLYADLAARLDKKMKYHWWNFSNLMKEEKVGAKYIEKGMIWDTKHNVNALQNAKGAIQTAYNTLLTAQEEHKTAKQEYKNEQTRQDESKIATAKKKYFNAIKSLGLKQNGTPDKDKKGGAYHKLYFALAMEKNRRIKYLKKSFEDNDFPEGGGASVKFEQRLPKGKTANDILKKVFTKEPVKIFENYGALYKACNVKKLYALQDEIQIYNPQKTLDMVNNAIYARNIKEWKKRNDVDWV